MKQQQKQAEGVQISQRTPSLSGTPILDQELSRTKDANTPNLGQYEQAENDGIGVNRTDATLPVQNQLKIKQSQDIDIDVSASQDNAVEGAAIVVNGQ